MNSEQLELMSQLWDKMEQATIYDRILGYLNQGAKMYPVNMFYLIAEVLNTNMISIDVKIGSHEFEFWDVDAWFKGWSPKWSKNNLFKNLANWIWDKDVQEKFQTHKTITANLVVEELIKILNDSLERFIEWAKEDISYTYKEYVVINGGLGELLDDLTDFQISYPQLQFDWLKCINRAYASYKRYVRRRRKQSE